MSPTDSLIFSITSNSLAVGATCTIRRVAPKLLRFYVLKEPYEESHIDTSRDSSKSWV